MEYGSYEAQNNADPSACGGVEFVVYQLILRIVLSWIPSSIE